MSTHQQSSVCRHATPDVGNKIALGVLPCLASPQEMLYVVGLTVACASVHTRTTGTCDEHLRGVFSSEEQYRFHLLSSRNFTGHNRSDKLRLPFSTLLPERRWRGDGCWAFALSTDIWFAPTVTHDNLVARPLITFVAVLHKDGLVRAVKGDLLSTLKNTVIRAWTWARAAFQLNFGRNCWRTAPCHSSSNDSQTVEFFDEPGMIGLGMTGHVPQFIFVPCQFRANTDSQNYDAVRMRQLCRCLGFVG
mmetsp:Transcript_69645/g.116038  ORF Transcript_69645/g.116038 Transcript_69645/m.116038 type:complete len:248 (-) Transcript_69645:1146-1889(-)